MNKKLLLALFAALIIGMASCSKNPPDNGGGGGVTPPPTPPTYLKAPKNTKYQAIGYFPYYSSLTATSIPDAKLKMLDVACYAFAAINAEGIPVVNSPSVLRAFVTRCKAQGVKVLISLNGSHAYYKTMVSTAANRKKFTDALINIVETYNLDGIDNDWEYPKLSDGTAAGNLQLMKELSNYCHDPSRNKLLTMAICSGKYVGDNTAGIVTELFDYVDWFSVMVYDDHSTTVSGKHHSDFALLQVCYNYWVGTRGLDPKKFVAGLPAYGRASGITQTGTLRTFSAILSQGGDAYADQATVTSTSHPEPYTIYYNGITTIKQKVNFTREKGVGGFMFWEISQDVHDDRSIVKAACQEAGRL